jgi:hypothetical protein
LFIFSAEPWRKRFGVEKEVTELVEDEEVEVGSLKMFTLLYNKIMY